MTEKNILAFFHSREEAEQALQSMQAVQVIDSSIERIEKYPGDGIEQIMNPITGNFASLGNLSLDADYTNKSAAILSAADVSASGLSDGGQGGPTGRDVLLTVVVAEDDHKKALQIAKDHGGLV
jgi:hypothetical protein